MMMIKNAIKFFLLLLVFIVSAAKAQVKSFLLGAAYYPEYMPVQRVDADIILMKKAGINTVRMGESSWALFEPADGRFDFLWLDSIVNKMYAAGIHVIIGTPTYSIPAWMALKHPSVLAKHKWGGQFDYGGRCTHDITNPVYLYYARRIVKKIVAHYASHPAVIGFQIDNESKTNFLGNQKYYEELKVFVKKKFKTTQQLNKLWGLNYWGQTVNNWGELPSVKGTVFNGYKLALEEFNHLTITNFLKWQAGIVKKYKRAQQFITHNFDLFEGGPHPAVRQDSIASFLDYAGTDIYHGWQNDFTGAEIACGGDYTRCLKRKQYLVIETNAQTTTINPKGQQPPFDGQLRLALYAHIAAGAAMVGYWHWHSTHAGAEIYWKGILSHDLKPNRAYEEIKAISAELKPIEALLINLQIKNRVALFYSHASKLAIENEPSLANSDYQNEFVQLHKCLYEMNIGTDIITVADSLEKYDVVVVPALYVAPQHLLKKLIAYAQKGGHIIFTPKSGYADENALVRNLTQPALIANAAGVYYQEFASLQQPEQLVSNIAAFDSSVKGCKRAELLVADSGLVLYRYTNSLLKNYAAAVTNFYGSGSITYIGTQLNNAAFKKLYISLGQRYQWPIETTCKAISFPVIIKKAYQPSGHTVHFMFNFSGDEQTVADSLIKGKSLFSNQDIGIGMPIKLPPWGVQIIIE
jgi:beta-galactosidase